MSQPDSRARAKSIGHYILGVWEVGRAKRSKWVDKSKPWMKSSLNIFFPSLTAKWTKREVPWSSYVKQDERRVPRWWHRHATIIWQVFFAAWKRVQGSEIGAAHVLQDSGFNPLFFLLKKLTFLPQILEGRWCCVLFSSSWQGVMWDSSVAGKTIGEGTFGKVPSQHVCITCRCRPTQKSLALYHLLGWLQVKLGTHILTSERVAVKVSHGPVSLFTSLEFPSALSLF